MGKTDVLYLARLKTANVASILIHCLRSLMVTRKTKLQTTVVKTLFPNVEKSVALACYISTLVNDVYTLNIYIYVMQ